MSHIHTHGQMAEQIANLPPIKWDESELVADLTDKEKIQRLSMLPKGDSVQFENPMYDPEYPDDYERYLPLDTAGLKFIDLNMDGKLDLLYSAQSGTMGKYDTKVYFLKDDQFEYHGLLPGRLIHIQKTDDKKLVVYTYWKPCCDSYTSRIEIHLFSATEQGTFGSSISIIGKLVEKIEIDTVAMKVAEWNALYPFPLSTWRDFSQLKRGRLNQIELVAFQEDFRGLSPYFRSRNQEIKNQLGSGKPVTLLSMDTSVDVRLIAQEKFRGENWYLVLTEPLDNVPNSLYEWSAGDNRQFVGWVHHKDLK